MWAKIVPEMDWRLVVAFPFVGVGYAGIFELLRDLPSISHSLE